MTYAAYDPRSLLTESVLTRRAMAWVVDLFLIGVLVSLAWVAVFALGVLTLGLGFALIPGLPLIGIFYHILFVASRGATPGQMLLDLVVRREDDFGPPGLLRAIVFTVGLWLTLGTGFWLLAFALFTPGKRALHDMVAGVIVVRYRALTLASGYPNMRFGSPIR